MHWQEAVMLRYWWQELVPDSVQGGEGSVHYDAGRSGYVLHNRYAGSDGELDYLLDERTGTFWVSELRDGKRTCSRHSTDRRVELNRNLRDGRRRGKGIVNGIEVTLFEYREAGDHDRWLWFVDADGRPLRFLTWTHHGKILVLHDVTAFEQADDFAEEIFRPDPEWGCEPVS